MVIQNPKQFIFLAGVARSGSTVLASILSQNPLFYATPTSPLLDILIKTEENWKAISQSHASGTDVQLSNLYQGIIQSMWAHIDKPIIIDKHRAWPRNVNGIKNIFAVEPKIIVTVRDMAEVQASFLRLIKARPYESFIDQELMSRGIPLTDEHRLDYLWDNYTKDPWTSVKIGYENYREYLFFIEYIDLMEKPYKILENLYEFLEFPYFHHDLKNIHNTVPEKDEFWGLKGLHDIRPQLGRISPEAFVELGPFVEKYRGLEFWR